MKLAWTIRWLFGGSTTPSSPEALSEAPGSSQEAVLVLRRGPDSFYHALSDEEFVSWLRPWCGSPQVLRAADREFLLDRTRSESLAPGP